MAVEVARTPACATRVQSNATYRQYAIDRYSTAVTIDERSGEMIAFHAFVHTSHDNNCCAIHMSMHKHASAHVIDCMCGDSMIFCQTNSLSIVADMARAGVCVNERANERDTLKQTNM